MKLESVLLGLVVVAALVSACADDPWQPEMCDLPCESAPYEPELACYMIDQYGPGGTYGADGRLEANCCNVDGEGWHEPRCFVAPRHRP